MADGIRIGELAKRVACPVETIRYYEREGLVPDPGRTAGNYRLYGAGHIARLSFIRHCRSLDMTLNEIRTLLKFRNAPEQRCDEVNSLLDHHLREVANRIAELQKLDKHLKDLRRLCKKAQAAKDCGILNELAQAAGASGPDRKKRTSSRLRPTSATLAIRKR